MNQSPTYYTLAELFQQRGTALAFGMDVEFLNVEIELQAAYEQGQSVLARPFDQEID